MSRPYCLDAGDCKAAKPTTHCRRCSASRLKADPQIEAKRHAAVAEYHSRPEVKAELAARIHAAQAKALADPEKRERLREHGRKLHREVLCRPDVIARTYRPEANAQRGASCRETWLAWCPAEYRDEYRRLIYTKRMLAAEARAIIEAEIAGTRENAKRLVANARAAGRLKHEREVASRY